MILCFISTLIIVWQKEKCVTPTTLLVLISLAVSLGFELKYWKKIQLNCCLLYFALFCKHTTGYKLNMCSTFTMQQTHQVT